MKAVVRAPAASFQDALQHIAVVADDGGDAMPAPGHVLVRVKAACLNYPDLLQTTAGYQHKQEFPYTPGMEMAGVVERVGEGCAHVRVGQSVMAFVGGSAGTLRTHVVLPEAHCLESVPQGLSFAQGAAFRMGYETAFHSLVERGDMQVTDVVLVNGATGGMGFAAAQLAKQVWGCTVIATGGSDEKLEVVRAVAGADHVINYTTTPDFSKRVKELTGGKGVSLVYDTVGGAVFDQGLRSTGFGARVLVVGFTSGERPKIPANYVLIKCLTVLGCRAGEMMKRDPDGEARIAGPRYARLRNYAERGWLKPHVCKTFAFGTDGVRAAYASFIDRSVVGRVCVVMDDVMDDHDDVVQVAQSAKL